MENSRKSLIDFVDKAVAAASLLNRDELMFSYKGILYPVTICSPEAFKALESFEARSDDVILAGYPKSGTNWLRRILNDLIAISQNKTLSKESSGDAEKPEEIPYLEVGDPEKYERMMKLPSPRFMATHLCPENLPTSIFRNKVKILLLVRNPKDVATSFFHFSNGLGIFPSYDTWDDFFTDFMSKKVAWGSYFEYLYEWNKYIDKENIMTITYEELKENCALGVKNIAAFFRIPLTEEELQLVVERSSFQSMKKNLEKTHRTISNILFRKGGVSDWKNLFSEEQNEKMDKVFEEQVAGTKLGKKLKYDVYCKA
ncbi:sulfotransferase 6B1-like [Oenanthe melanoleuca]|uniref:sulfotransferase 6B1-like n=1 Tax=Oenanthe melanoleuca TaxID=2939378 RepID=UPI0024C145F4|nr:sulfotransferase 6B1-like [Oenanthe melanoleuca]